MPKQHLFGLLEDIFYKKEKYYSWDEILKSLSEYIEWLSQITNNFDITKNYSEEHLAEQLFSIPPFTKMVCKYHICALKIAIEQLYEELQLTKKDGYPAETDFVKGKLALLKDLVWDGYELIGICEKNYLKKKPTIGLGRRRLFSSNEIFYSSINLLRRHFTYDDITYSSLAIFQIRQAIETKVLNSLGIGHIEDKNNEMARFKLEQLIEFIDQNPKIKFPIKKSLLLKITKWTNYYIHRGIMNYHWMIILAHNILMPLFESGKGKTQYSVYGAIKIDKDYFDNSLEAELLSYLGLSGCKIVKMSHPEAIIEPFH